MLVDVFGRDVEECQGKRPLVGNDVFVGDVIHVLFKIAGKGAEIRFLFLFGCGLPGALEILERKLGVDGKERVTHLDDGVYTLAASQGVLELEERFG